MAANTPVIAAEGGTAIELAANTPNACAGDDLARGALNSSAAWSPEVRSFGGKRYYFLVFTSGRKYGDEFASQFQFESSWASAYKGLNDSTQLYLTAVVIDDTTGEMTSYPALYIWTQNRLETSGSVVTQFSHLTSSWVAE